MSSSQCSNKSFSLNCANCSLNQLCIPFSLDETELRRLDDVIERKKPFHKSDCMVEAGQTFTSLYAIRSGSFKSYLVDDQGVEQITGFHLPGDVIGFDGLAKLKHQTYCQALETSMVCEIPYTTMDELVEKMPKLRSQFTRLMSSEISSDQNMFMLLNKKTAEQRIASFLTTLSDRFAERGLSKNSFRLTMTRGEIGNYLGLTVETVSRIFSKFQKSGFIQVDGKLIEIKDVEKFRRLEE
ncbi:fumarate and nitrate reduction regulatory protein [Psychrosphaera saromensis]|uniref:Transcriptional regulator FNR n=1 Tax=Psychrosphaera saromensis TaxID=716813 RepID=A0A2S7UWA1_9GAMM|nr:fumarate/nitrate reduction transcriptional regulator Fnr [Psychrosphaera saromensis]PQJ54264.1 transcriptional regulator FNR [Psychrosphaera saromensis]GHB74687.1 fumarate and nitrate reduction regulatory protein [Psychrosphaera saromensis]GLQ12635.1 fumarate and nitrate reduction regulatory protein [Psychrosphaera saromensis]